MPTINLERLFSDELTDASPTLTEIVDCNTSENLYVDIVIDKGSTVVVTPIFDKTDDTAEGKPSATLTIADSGATERAVYSNIGSVRAKIVVTKTEAGSTSGFLCRISGFQPTL